MQGIRCFVAINLPEDIKNAIEKEKQDIIRQFPERSGLLALKWVRKENLHLTLLFLGEIKTENLPKVIEKLKEAVVRVDPVRGDGASPVSNRVDELKIKINRICYGLIKKAEPRLIWLETEENEFLNELSKRISEELSAFCKMPSKGFISHITLARVRAWQFRKIEPEEIPEIDKPLDLTFTTSAVDLMESKMSRFGPTYTALQSLNL